MGKRSSTGTGGSRRRGALSVLLAVVTVVCALVAIAGIVAWAELYRPTRTVERGAHVAVEVRHGASTAEIGDVLAGKGVVANANMFRLQTRLAKADGKLRAGTYELATGMPYDLVIEKLIAGPPPKYVTVTIPEGWTVAQIAKRLDKQANIPADEFLALANGGAEEFAADHPYLKGAYKGKLEGYLFPKTYRFVEGTTARQAIETMLDQFDKEMSQVDLSSAEKKGYSAQDVVIIASIIEREAQIAKERPLVSSVIYNRLARNMRLEICATIQYVLPVNRFRLTWRETRTPTPYNTYLHKGLTPGPISNPGLASLKAAAAPADTDFIYYVLTGKDGSQTYATNAADFAKAKQKSKEVFGR